MKLSLAITGNGLMIVLPNFVYNCDTRISFPVLPGVYPAIKPKCWAGQQTLQNTDGEWKCACDVHIYPKTQHSCMQTVASFTSFPGKRLYRAIARGVRFLAKTIFVGWAFSDVPKTGDETETGFSK
eukprot:9440841-Karenia_brevis.AAC.1